MVVPRLLGSEAFVGRVAGVSKPRPLLKLVHAVMCLFCDMRGKIRSFKCVNVKRQLISLSTTLHTTEAKKAWEAPWWQRCVACVSDVIELQLSIRAKWQNCVSNDLFTLFYVI